MQATVTTPVPAAQPEARRIIALAFDEVGEAHEALAAALRLQEQELVTVHDAVYVLRGADGRVTVETSLDPAPVAAAVPSTLFGALVGSIVAGPLGFLVGGVLAGGSGALIARLVEVGIPHPVIGELQELTRPGQTVLALLVSDVAAMIVIEELRRFRGARVVYAKVPPTALELVRQAFGGRAKD